MKVLNVMRFTEAAAFTAFAMLAGAGCFYRITDEPAPYIMPTEIHSYEIGTDPSQNETPVSENETSFTEMVTVPDETQEVAPVQPEKIYDVPLPAGLQHDIMELAGKYELAYELVLAVIMTESSGNPDAVGDGGCSIGLMQIQPRWHQELIDATGLSVDEPVENVELGILFLLECLEENEGSLDRALRQYNSGTPDYPGDEYIKQVYSWYDFFEEERDDGGRADE